RFFAASSDALAAGTVGGSCSGGRGGCGGGSEGAGRTLASGVVGGNGATGALPVVAGARSFAPKTTPIGANAANATRHAARPRGRGEGVTVTASFAWVPPPGRGAFAGTPRASTSSAGSFGARTAANASAKASAL